MSENNTLSQTINCLSCDSHIIYGSCHYVDVWCSFKKQYIYEPFEICWNHHRELTDEQKKAIRDSSTSTKKEGEE